MKGLCKVLSVLCIVFLVLFIVSFILKINAYFELKRLINSFPKDLTEEFSQLTSLAKPGILDFFIFALEVITCLSLFLFFDELVKKTDKLEKEN